MRAYCPISSFVSMLRDPHVRVMSVLLYITGRAHRKGELFAGAMRNDAGVGVHLGFAVALARRHLALVPEGVPCVSGPSKGGYKAHQSEMEGS